MRVMGGRIAQGMSSPELHTEPTSYDFVPARQAGAAGAPSGAEPIGTPPSIDHIANLVLSHGRTRVQMVSKHAESP